MSATTSSRQRPVPAPLRSAQSARKAAPPIPTESSGMPTSKSQQLALAIAAEDPDSLHYDADSNHAATHFRPDSQWSEGGADVVWHGNGADHGMPSPALPSQYRNTYASSNAGATDSYHQGEFADADEGYEHDDTQPNFRFQSDDTYSADDDTTFTTLSAGSSAKKGSSFNSQQASGMPLSAIKNGVNAPVRPQRKAPRPSPALDASHDEDNRNSFVSEDDDGGKTFGLSRTASIGSSIWAGRGAKTMMDAKDHWPPMPDMLNEASAERDGHPGHRSSFDEAGSVYSQGAASEWDVTSPRQRAEAQHYLEQTPPLDRLRHLAGENGGQNHVSSPRDDDFEMMDTQSIYEGRNSGASSSIVSPPLTAEPERRLADGTVVPKMPPVPSQFGAHPSSAQQQQSGKNAARSRSKKGRQQRSPILSYADGEEEEARLVQEREASDSTQAATNLGPRLKKNSPAPWELDEEMEQRDGGASVFAMSSRPSTDNVAGSIKQPANWARQSVEQFRNRGGSAAPSSASSGTLSTSKSTSTTMPTSYANNGLISPTPAFMSGNGRTVSNSSSATGAAADEENQQSEAARRGRTKSMSGSAAGMLKGLGLASGSSSTSTPQKKQSSSRLAKAFRSNKNTAPAPAATLAAPSSEMGSRKLSRGISSDDYPHSPTSPAMTQSNANLSVATSPYMANSSTHSHSSLSHRSDNMSDKGSPLPSVSPVPPITAAMRSAVTSSPPMTAHGTTLSADSHSMGGSSSSHAGMRNRAEIMDVLASSKRGASSSETTADSSTPNTPSMQQFKYPSNSLSSNPASPQKQAFGAYKNVNGYPHADQRMYAPIVPAASVKSPVPPRQSSASSEGAQNAAYRSQESQPTHSGKAAGELALAPAANMVRLPSVGAHEGVPYKLISLEEARAQQHKQQSGVGQRGGEETVSIPASASDKTLPDMSERERNLKTKKSGGFLRRFGNKERSDTSPMPGSTDGFGPLPSFATSSQMQQAQRGAEQQLQAPPTLSVRPMSSMFTGLAPGLFDSMTVGEQIKEGDEGGAASDLLAAMPTSANAALQDRLSPTTAQFRPGGLRSPRSPAITLASMDSNASAGDYYDAIERPQQQSVGVKTASANAANMRGGASHAALSPSPNVARRQSTDSTHSDESSALGLVSGFPGLPASATAVGLEGAGSPSQARATRQRALEIEAKMTELLAELVKLRTFAVDCGFARPAGPASSNGGASPNPLLLTPDMNGAGVETLSDVETPPMPHSATLGGDLVEAVSPSPSTIAAADVLMTPIPPCTQCGCLCADQKRLQSLNELAILKGISVLDRGRALKPLAGQNGSKFGGYLDR